MTTRPLAYIYLMHSTGTSVRHDPPLLELFEDIEIPYPMSFLKPWMVLRLADEYQFRTWKTTERGIPLVKNDKYYVCKADLASFTQSLKALPLEERYAFVENRAKKLMTYRNVSRT